MCAHIYSHRYRYTRIRIGIPQTPHTPKSINVFISPYAECCGFSSHQSAAHFSIGSCLPRGTCSRGPALGPPRRSSGPRTGAVQSPVPLTPLTQRGGSPPPRSPPTSHGGDSKATPASTVQSQATHLPCELAKQTSAQGPLPRRAICRPDSFQGEGYYINRWQNEKILKSRLF